ASDSFRGRPATEKKKENQNQTLVASLASTHGVDHACRPRTTPAHTAPPNKQKSQGRLLLRLWLLLWIETRVRGRRPG
ncbi:hypothetical protein, partial [Stenotrophomonas indicatrix]|uniref:hypothetical protein n=1 Tax=Stenotrophomonas indicatrix TaxID=2045451 RepID=UPI001980B448